MDIFTDEWAFALKDIVNEHPYFKEAAAKWVHGPVGFTVLFNDEEREDLSLFLHIHEGECLYTMMLSATDGRRACEFILEADFPTWERIFHQEQTMIIAFLTGKMKLTKGSFYKSLGMEKASVYFIQAAATLN